MNSEQEEKKKENHENENKNGDRPNPDHEKIRKLVQEVGNSYFFECPHCDGPIEVEKHAVACRIFRHASFKRPNCEPIPPHTPKAQCEELLTQNLVHGCTRPFLFVFAQPQNYVEICDYI